MEPIGNMPFYLLFFGGEVRSSEKRRQRDASIELTVIFFFFHFILYVFICISSNIYTTADNTYLPT